MPDNWLQTRLSPVKKDTVRWQELAQAIETFWQENFDADAARLDGLKSIFTATRSDQLAILSESGKYYDIDLPDDSIPLAIIQRRMELFQKDTLVPLTESLKRACPGISTEWLPLFTFDLQQYGSSFYTERELSRLNWWPAPSTHYLDGSWPVLSPTDICLTQNSGGSIAPYMTSRAKIFIDESNIEDPEQIEATIRSRIALIKPLHIVLHGIIWYVAVSISVETGDTETSQNIASWNRLPVFSCHIPVNGSWLLDGDTYLCADNGDLRYQYPVDTGSMSIISNASVECQVMPTLFGTHLDGSLLIDGTWEIEDI